MKFFWEAISAMRMLRVLGASNTFKTKVLANRKGDDISLRLPGVEEPFTIRRRTSDAWVVEQIFACQQYAGILPFAPKTIIDAGANIGAASCWLSREFPEANIVALEPDPENYELLVRNTRTNPRITTRQVGLWSKPASLKIVHPGAEKYAIRVEECDQGGGIEATSIEQIRLDMNWDNIDLVKMDIEGSEGMVLSQAENWINCVRALVIELHPDIDPEGPANLFKCFADRKFHLSWRGENLTLIQDL